jgi:glycosyltransferase involved in cell wall biosynthesis
MRIAVNVRFLMSGKLEGMGWFAYEILRRIVVKHPEHQFFFLFDRKSDPAFIFSNNVTAIELFPPARHPFLWYAWFEVAVPRVLKKLKVDAFISTDGFCSLSAKTPTLMFWHDASYLFEPAHIGAGTRKYYQHFVPKYLKRADHIITFSESARDDLNQYFMVPATKVSVSKGAANAAFQPLSQTKQLATRARCSGGAPYFLYVGAIHPRKNVHTLISAFDAFKQAHLNDYKLLLAGRFAWKTKAVKAAFAQALHSKDIVFLGHMERRDLTEVVASAHCLVYPSLYEGFGLPVLEAIQCGVPVITSNISSLPEVAGEAGLLVEPRDRAALTAAIQKMAFDEEGYKRFVAACAAQAKKFDWDNTAGDVYEALAKTVGRVPF